MGWECDEGATPLLQVREMASDPSKLEVLKVVYSCYRLLFFICWDHPENWEHFSNTETIHFLMSQVRKCCTHRIRHASRGDGRLQ